MRQAGACPSAYFDKRWQERNDLAQTYLNNLKAWPGLKVDLVEKRIGEVAYRLDSSDQLGENSPLFHVSQLTSIRPDPPREERAHEGTTRGK